MRVLVRSNRLTCFGATWGFACLLVSWPVASSQQATTQPSVMPGVPASMAFDKVMMFPENGDDAGGFLWWDPASYNGWLFHNVSSSKLIANAYGLGVRQVVGLPSWAETDRFGLQANMPEDEFAAFEKLPTDEQVRQQRLMTQAVLADRYQLKTHRETREVPVYELVVANGAPKIAETDLDGHSGSSFFRPRDWWNYGTMEDLASKLAGPAGGIVVDKTDLGSKRFQYHLTWTGDGQNSAAAGGPSIFAALENQLGLKLVPATERVEFLVIDHIEKPTTGMYPKGLSRSSL